jgi:hypothetical protein
LHFYEGDTIVFNITTAPTSAGHRSKLGSAPFALCKGEPPLGKDLFGFEWDGVHYRYFRDAAGGSGEMIGVQFYDYNDTTPYWLNAGCCPDCESYSLTTQEP